MVRGFASAAPFYGNFAGYLLVSWFGTRVNATMRANNMLVSIPEEKIHYGAKSATRKTITMAVRKIFRLRASLFGRIQRC